MSERKPFEISKEWCVNAAKREAEHGDLDCTVLPPSMLGDEIRRLTALLTEAQSALATARREALEEAEKVALSCIRFGELRDNAVCDRIARDIRALLSQSVEVGRPSDGDGEAGA